MKDTTNLTFIWVGVTLAIMLFLIYVNDYISSERLDRIESKLELTKEIK